MNPVREGAQESSPTPFQSNRLPPGQVVASDANRAIAQAPFVAELALANRKISELRHASQREAGRTAQGEALGVHFRRMIQPRKDGMIPPMCWIAVHEIARVAPVIDGSFASNYALARAVQVPR